MTEPVMPTEWPEGPHCLVMWRTATIANDGPDAGHDPDWNPRTGLEVRLVPSVSGWIVYDGPLGKISAEALPVIAVINADGYLISPVTGEYLRVLPTDDPNVSPSGWTYKVSVTNKQVAAIPAPTGGVVDISDFINAASIPAPQQPGFVQQLVAESAALRALIEAGGGGGSGVEYVAGEVTLDGTSAPLREFFTTAETTFTSATGQVTIPAATAIVWRRDAEGAWGYRVVDEWSAPAPAAPTGLAAAPTSDGAVLTWDAVSGATGYVVRVNTSAWTEVTGTTYTATGLPSGDHTWEVAAVGGSAASGTFTVALPPGFGWGTDYFDTATATTLDQHHAVFEWHAKDWGGGHGLPSAVPAVHSGAVWGPSSAAVTLPTEDARISARYSIMGGEGPQQFRLIARGGGCMVTVGSDGTIRDSTWTSITTDIPMVELQQGVLSLEVVGTVGKLWHNGRILTSSLPVNPTISDDWGFTLFAAANVATAVKLEAGAESMAAPTLPERTATAGTVLASEGFTGADTATVAGRILDAASGAVLPTRWAGLAFSGWSAPGLGISSNQAVRVGTDHNASGVLIPYRNLSIRATLVAIPNGGDTQLSLGARWPGGDVDLSIRVSPTAITPYGRNNAQSSLGAPQAGDVYTLTLNGTTATVTGQRADTTAIGSTTFTVTRADTAYWAAIYHRPGNTTAIWDNLEWKAA